MGTSFVFTSYILKPSFYNAVITDITEKTTQYGPAYEIKFDIMDNVPLTKGAADDMSSLGKQVRKTFTAKEKLPNGDLNFPLTGEYRNTVEMLATSNNLVLDEALKNEKLLKGCKCRVIVVNSAPDAKGIIWNNIQKGGIQGPDADTFAAYETWANWKRAQKQNAGTVQGAISQPTVENVNPTPAPTSTSPASIQNAPPVQQNSTAIKDADLFS